MASPRLAVAQTQHGSPSTAEVSVIARAVEVAFAAIAGSVVSLMAALRFLRDDGPGFDSEYREAVNALRERMRRNKKVSRHR